MPDDAPAVRAELRSLSRWVRVLGLLLVGALLLAGAALWQALRPARQEPVGEPGVLVGRSLYLREDPDNPYVRLKYLQDGAGLILAGAEGRGRVQLVAGVSGGRLVLGGPRRLVLDGSPEGASLALYDGRERRRLTLGADGGPGVELLDEGGRVRLRMAAGPTGASLALLDAAGRPRALLEQGGDAVRLRLMDARGQVMFETPQAGGHRP